MPSPKYGMRGIYSDSEEETVMDNKLDIRAFLGYISPRGIFKFLFVRVFSAAQGPHCRGGFSPAAVGGG